MVARRPGLDNARAAMAVSGRSRAFKLNLTTGLSLSFALSARSAPLSLAIGFSFPLSFRFRWRSFTPAFLGLAAALLWSSVAGGQEPAGAAIYKQKCARCHGKVGEGTRDHPHLLVGNRSLPQLSKYIAKSMPEDDPGTCIGADADKVAAYIFDAFYSPAARARNKAPRL